MEGKVIDVERKEWYTGAQSIQNSSSEHNIRHTNTFAKLDNGDNVIINEGDILNTFNRTRFSDKIIKELKDKLLGENINYSEVDGDYQLDGSVSQYLN